MGLSISHLLIILLIILVLFGAGKLPQVMSELGKGIKSFRDGMKNESHEEEKPKKIQKSKVNKK
jgi:sec-independent protein translocase protein TatA